MHTPDAALPFRFDNTYARLPESFFTRQNPTPVQAPQLVILNTELARGLALNLAPLAAPELAQIFAGNHLPTGAQPLAQAYAGHQFGHFVPQLGDGRAILLGEVVGHDGIRYDIALKGSGRTAYSRGGDGRAALGPVLREYIVSEAMAALGVPTTRSLAVVTTGESVQRDAALPGAILTRVAASHLRVGTFELFASRLDTNATRRLADFAIARHDPAAAQAAHPYRALLDGVIARQARLIAQWMLLGFIHGVMNTDNMTISGQTIDYGPCAFLETYDPDTVFSAIDQYGRYAYANQPRLALWNLARLTEALLPLLSIEAGSEEAAVTAANQSLAAFEPLFQAARSAGLRRKLGLFTEQPGDSALADDLLDRMASNRADFTLTFRYLCAAAEASEADQLLRDLFAEPAAYDHWAARWRLRLDAEQIPSSRRAAAMRRANPLFIPRNHLVEEVIRAATYHSDFQPFYRLLDVLAHPCLERPGLERFALPARPEQMVLQTFCGT